MMVDPRVLDLLLRWEEERDRGRHLTPEELCRDCPELLDTVREQLAGLEALDPIMGTPPAPVPPLPGPRPAAPLPPPAPDGPRFRPLRLHAKGGLGEVFLARDAELNREVALKQMPAHLVGNEDHRRRFLLEAEVTGRLEHPGIVPVYGLGVDAQGCPYYAMRFIQGDSLREAIQGFHRAEGSVRDPGKRSLELRRLLTRFVAVCNAVAYAHSRGIIHRDIKPANVMLGPYGETLVVDWGLARPVSRSEADRAAGEGTLRPGHRPDATLGAVGTPAYMAPEQAAGRQTLVGPLSDVYSLGATLYHLLTGHAPFDRAPLDEMLEKVQQGAFPPPRQRNPNVPAALEAVCLKAMALQREERYPGPSELARDVEAWLADEPVSARREPLIERARRWLKRRRTAVMTTLAAGAVALVALTLSTVLLNRANEAERKARAEAEASAGEAVQARLEETKARLAAQESEKRTREHFYASTIALAWQALQEGKVVRARQFLRELLPGPGEEDLRGFEWHYLWRQCQTTGQRRLTGHTQAVTALSFAPDGDVIASGSRDGTAMLWEADSGRPLAVLSPNPEDREGGVGVRWVNRQGKVSVGLILPGSSAAIDRRLQRGDELVAISGPEGKMVPAEGLSVADVVRLERGLVGTPVVLRVRTLTGLHSYTLTRRRILRSLGSGSGGGTDRPVLVGFSPDGKVLATASGTAVRLWEPDGSKVRHTLTGHTKAVSALAFSADGKWLATGDVGGQTRLWDVAGGERVATLTPESLAAPPRIQALAFSPDGQTLLASAGAYLIAWDVQKRSPGEVRFQWEKPIGSLAYFPHSRRFALGRQGARDNLELWDADPLKRWAYLPGHTDWVQALAMTPDGRTLASSSTDHTVRLWDPQQARLLTTLRGHEGTVGAVACSADSKRIASGDAEGTILLWGRARELEGPTLITSSLFAAHRVAIGPEGRRLFAATGEHLGGSDGGGGIEVWDPKTRQLQGRVCGPAPWPYDVAFSPDGKTLALALGDGGLPAMPGECRLYDVATGKRLLRLKDFPNMVGSAVWSADGKVLVTTTGDYMKDLVTGEVCFHDPATGRRWLTLRPHRGSCLAGLAGDGKTLLTWGGLTRRSPKPTMIAWWDIHTGKQLGKLEGDFSPLLAVALTPDRKVLAVAPGEIARPNQPGEVRLLDAENGKVLARLSGHESAVTCLALAPDGKTLATGSWNKRIRLFEVPGGKLKETLPPQQGMITTLAFSADGKRLAAGIAPAGGFVVPGSRGQARVWEVGTWKRLAGVALPPNAFPVAGLSPDGRLLATANTQGGARVWEVENGKETHRLEPDDPFGLGDKQDLSLACMALSPDGKTLATGGKDREVALWDLSTRTKDRIGKLTGTVPAGGVVSCLAFSPEGKTLAWGTGGSLRVRHPGALTLYDLAGKKTRAVLPVGPAGVTALAFLADGKTLAATTDHFPVTGETPSELFLVEVGTGERTRTVYKQSFASYCLAASPDGRTLALDWGNGTIQLIDSRTGEVRQLVGHTRPLNSLAFAPDGKTLASGSSDGTLKLWHLATGREMISLRHEHWVMGLTFSPDGRTLASGTETNRRGTVHLWEGGPAAQQLAVWYDPAETGYARAVFTMDERGRLIEIATFDSNGRPAAASTGQARTVITRSPEGQVTGRSYFDATGRELYEQFEIDGVIPRGPGEKLGLRAGDVLVAYNGRPITSVSRLATLEQQEPKEGAEADARRPLVVRRAGEQHIFQAPAGRLQIRLRMRLVGRAE